MATEAKVSVLPQCNFCGGEARYDFKTQMGQWAYGCQVDYEAYRLYQNLGTGMGQRLVLICGKQAACDPDKECLRAPHETGDHCAGQHDDSPEAGTF